MARMVEEQRGQIGILKALGYNNFDISKKFIIYGLLASIVATVIGVILGYEFLTKFIYEAYSLGNMIKGGPIEYYISYIVISVVIALFCTVGIALIVLNNSLKTKTAYLLRPKPPKAGSRIFLERIKIIWNRLKFIQKVTFRNLFRYKARMIMTIIGIAGCVALLVAGFGLKDSVIDIASKQYESIFLFDDIVLTNKQASKESLEEYEKYLSSNDNIKSTKKFMYKTIHAKATNGIEQTIIIFIINDTSNIDDFVILKNRKTNQRLELNNDGVVITEKLANLMALKEDNKLEVYDKDNNQYSLNVTGISEMYGMHYMFMTDHVYKDVFNEEIEENADSIILHDDSEEKSNQLVTDLLTNEAVINVDSSQDMIRMINDFSIVLNSVILILIVCASILAFVVLYTLNNINIAERIRELSTIKVLGFYPKELTMYIYRETILLGIIGMLLGFLLGKLLHYTMINIVAPDPIMLVPSLVWSVFGLSSLITVVFSVIVMFVMHRKLKNIDMIEALKSVE